MRNILIHEYFGVDNKVLWKTIQEDLGTLPNIHKDPFDRIFIAQAITEKLILVTRDEVIARYKVQALKA